MGKALVAMDRRRTIEALEDEIATLCAHINAARFRLLDLIRRFDEVGGWDGHRSCAHWLAWRTGLHLGPARENVRVSHALPELPHTRESFRRGRISYSKVRAVTRVATPSNEEAFVRIAEAGTAHHLEKVVQAHRRQQALNDPERPRRQHRERYLRCYYDEDGMLVIRGRMPPDQGALVVQALRAATDELNQERLPSKPDEAADRASAGDRTLTADVPAGTPRHPEEPREEPEARKADALALVSEIALQNTKAGTKTADRYHVLVHVDARALHGFEHVPAGTPTANDTTAIPQRSHLEDGPHVPAEALRRITCDSSLTRVSEVTHGELLDVGRKTRTIPPALRRALHARDQGCRFPGCTARRFVDAHHIHHWADGGETKLGNLVLLCRFHHRLLHEEQYAIEHAENGTLRFLDCFRRPVPESPTLPRPPLDPLQTLHDAHSQDGLHIDAATLPVWTGDPIDMDIALAVVNR